MSIREDSKALLSLAKAEGKINKLSKLIQLDEESLCRPDGFLNRHAKIETRLSKYYAELEEAENAYHNFDLLNNSTLPHIQTDEQRQAEIDERYESQELNAQMVKDVDAGYYGEEANTSVLKQHPELVYSIAETQFNKKWANYDEDVSKAIKAKDATLLVSLIDQFTKDKSALKKMFFDKECIGMTQSERRACEISFYKEVLAEGKAIFNQDLDSGL